MPQNAIKNRNTHVLVFAGLLIVIIGVAYILLDSKSKTNSVGNSRLPAAESVKKENLQVDVRGENNAVTQVVKQVAKHIILPDGNVTVTTIIDLEGLKKENPLLYEFAKPGDKVLVYADRLIVYDPIADIVLGLQYRNK